MKNTKIKVAIEGTKMVSGFGVAYMVGSLCSNLVPPQAKLITKVATTVGAVGIQGAVNIGVDKYWDDLGDTIEETIDAVKELTKTIKNEQEKVEKEEKPKKKKETKKKSKKKSNKEIEVEFEEIEDEIEEA